MENTFEVGQKLNIQIRSLGINGEGIGYSNKMAIFVDYALPDENVDIEIVEVFDNRLVGKIIEIIKPSEFRIEPFCPIYEKCGGCQLQHYDPIKVSESKKEILVEALRRYAKHGIDFDLVKDTIRSDKEVGYRNKASLPVRFNGRNHVGMYEANSRKFIQMDACPIQNPVVNEIVSSILRLLDIYKIKGYDEKYKQGDIASLVVRTSSIDEVQVTFVMLKNHSKLIELAKELIEKDPRIVSVFKVIDKKFQAIGFFNSSLVKLAGKDTIHEVLHGYHFQLKPEAFFQLNPNQADKFYSEMVRLAELKKHDVVIDAFAGSAPVSHYIAALCRQVYAIEIDKEACHSAKISLEKNGITNVTVLQSDFKRALSGLQKKRIDVMFFDPPRIGLGEETIELILKARPRKIIYGSCNPSTLAKDLNLLLKAYDLKEIIPIDMFPQTALVESISLLVLKQQNK
ncbi:MAG: 23S rRNA (uracil(1939)-C(5))-methyltransferase RlmD [Acholeplasmataceae bacterium]